MKRYLSLLLALLLIFSAFSLISVSAEDDESGLSSLPEVKEGYNRYFFLLPEDWFWDPSNTVGIYWSEGTDAPESWPGYKAHKADVDNVYYYDVPTDVENIIWNNFYENVDISASLSRYNKRTDYVPTSDTLNEISYNGMIAVVNPNWKENKESGNLYPPCDWYLYHDNGEYSDIVTSEKEDTHYRYFFYLPEEWETEDCTPGVYWWYGSDRPSDYNGYKMLKTNVKGLYYYDIPQDVEYISFSNSVDFGYDSEGLFAVTSCKYKKDKVYVIDFDKTIYGFDNLEDEYIGDWYYFYGDGTYGITEYKGDKVYSCRSFGGDNPAPTVETNRYYFYMPEDWENILSLGAGIYWWEGINNCTEFWPGYPAHETEIDGLYYYDVPKDVTTVIWTNLVADHTWPYDSISSVAKQTKNIGTEYYEAGESPLYPEGTESFDNMVYVINYDDMYYELEGPVISGDWYYYYGDGEYGTTPEKGEVVYNTRQLGTIPNYKKTYPAENEITLYFLDKFNRSPIYITYVNNENGEEVTESCELSFMASLDVGTLYYANIPEDSESIYFSTDTQRSYDINKYIVHNACFEFGVTVNDKYDYKAYLLDEQLAKTDTLLGDANQDGKITIQDATAIQKHLANIKEIGGNAKTAADYNCDGKITIKDATAIQKKIANIA